MTVAHVVVGLSGGVDSAVSAHLLQESGYRVSGVFMVNWTADESGYCNAAEDFASARAVAEELAIPLERVDFSEQYHESVFRDFLDAYARGRTPNPDILCNRAIKFAPFLAHARRLGADLIATGHYARLVAAPDGPRLYGGIDADKDQSYFLAAVERAAFDGVLFPLGELHKTEVRAIARRLGLPNHQRKDSTGICFIGERRMRDFLAQYLPTKNGDIVDLDGKRLGEHPGVAFFTPGQRRGLELGGVKGARDAPWYVVDRDIAANRLIVDQDAQHPRLMAHALELRTPHWIHRPEGFVAGEPLPLWVRIRHRQPLQRAEFRSTASGARLDFADAQRAAAAGQYAVFYGDDGECYGCAEIEAGHAQA